MKEKLALIHTPWRRLLLSLALSLLAWWGRHASSRARIHWLGKSRPRRLERLFFITVLVLAMFALETRQYLLWSILWGGGASLFVILLSILRLVPQRNR